MASESSSIASDDDLGREPTNISPPANSQQVPRAQSTNSGNTEHEVLVGSRMSVTSRDRLIRTDEVLLGSATEGPGSASGGLPESERGHDDVAGVEQERMTHHSSQDDQESLDKLLALVGDQFELFEVAPVLDAVNGSKKVDNVVSGTAGLRNRRPLLFQRRKPQVDTQNAAPSTGSAPQVADGEVDHLDYLRRFNPDKPGEEKGPNARVWRVYLNEAGQFDANMVEKMMDTVDIILITAALFVAIVTTLVALTAAALQLDQPKVTNMLLMELIDLQRAQITNASIDQIPRYPITADSPATETASWTDYTATRLWFASLSLSMSAALLAMLVRQWIHSYIAPTFQGSAQKRAEIRHFRFHGFDAWNVPLIIDLLPTLLHLSLFLFFAGLVIFLHPLDRTIEILVAVFASLIFVAYVVTNLLPVWYASCPYKTPLSSYIRPLVVWCTIRTMTIYRNIYFHSSPFFDSENSQLWSRTLIRRTLIRTIYMPFGLAVRLPWYIIARPNENFSEFLFQPLRNLHAVLWEGTHPYPYKSMETEAIIAQGEALHSRMCVWILKTSSNPSARSIAKSTIIPNPADLVQIQPPMISLAEWAKILQQVLSAQVTNPDLMLDRTSFAPYRVLSGVNAHDLHEELLAVHQYCQIWTPLQFVDKTFDRSSYVNWDWHPAMHLWTSKTFLDRFWIHTLYDATEPSSSDTNPLPQADLTLLYPAMRRRTAHVHPTPDAMHRFRQWLPTPDHAKSLEPGTVTAPQLRSLLEVSIYLLNLDVGDTEDFHCAFKDAASLSFWRSIFERHHDVVSQDLAHAFTRMLCEYEGLISISDILNHLTTVCIWEAVRRAEYLPGYLKHLVDVDEEPQHPRWQEVRQTLIGLLHTEEEKTAGIALLQRLNSYSLEKHGEPLWTQTEVTTPLTGTIREIDHRFDASDNLENTSTDPAVGIASVSDSLSERICASDKPLPLDIDEQTRPESTSRSRILARALDLFTGPITDRPSHGSLV